MLLKTKKRERKRGRRQRLEKVAKKRKPLKSDGIRVKQTQKRVGTKGYFSKKGNMGHVKRAWMRAKY